MKPYLDESMIQKITHSSKMCAMRVVYYQPRLGKLCGWSFSLILNTERLGLALICLIEQVSLAALNLVGTAFNETAKKDLKITLTGIKNTSVRLARLIPMVFFDAHEFWNLSAENQELKTRQNWQPIHFAAAYNDIETLNQLLSTEHIDPNLEAKYQSFGTLYHETPLHVAVRYHNSECISLLLRAGADLTRQNTLEESPFEAAVMIETLHIIEAFLNNGVQANVKDTKGNTILHRAVTSEHYAKGFGTYNYNRAHYKEVIDLLVQKGANINEANHKGVTPLMVAASDDKVESIKALIEHGVDVNAKDSQGNTALHYAVERGRLDAFRALIACKTLAINAQNKQGQTVLHLAANKSGPQFISEIIGHSRLDPNVVDENNRTAYHYLKRRGVVIYRNDNETKHNDKKIELLLQLPTLNRKIQDIKGRIADDYFYHADISPSEREEMGHEIFDEGFNYIKKIHNF